MDVVENILGNKLNINEIDKKILYHQRMLAQSNTNTDRGKLDSQSHQKAIDDLYELKWKK